MGQSTAIQWCDSTVNPTLGCDGCELWLPQNGVKKCYASVLTERYGGKTKGYPPSFAQVTLFPGRMANAAKWKDLTGTARRDKSWLDGMSRLIFVSDMSDALSSVVPFHYLETEIIDVVISTDGRRHQWLWLTKRPQRMAEFSDYLKAKGTNWPENLWAGTSVTSQQTLARLHDLCRVGDDSTIRFLSVEPQYRRINFGDDLRRVDWVVHGGESGSNATPFHVEWAEGVLAQCRAVGVPYFLKQLGSRVVYQNRPHKLKGPCSAVSMSAAAGGGGSSSTAAREPFADTPAEEQKGQASPAWSFSQR